jgi:hypothetical protein
VIGAIGKSVSTAAHPVDLDAGFSIVRGRHGDARRSRRDPHVSHFALVSPAA